MEKHCSKGFLQTLRYAFPEGARILLVRMGPDPNPVPNDSRGEILHVDDMGTVHVRFDNGRVLGLIFGEDIFRPLSGDELEEEAKAKAI